MAKKATRLHFTEDELANPRVKKAASKAERAADKADRAAAKTPKKRKKNEVKTTKVGHKVKVIPTPTCTGNVAPTLMATGYATADYKNFYSVGHFPKLGILEVWKEDKSNNKK